MMLKNILTLMLMVIGIYCIGAQGHQITVELDNYQEEELYLGYYYGDKQYLRDTVRRNDKGLFIFESDTSQLQAGIYLVVMAPDNKYFQLMVNEDEQHFSVRTDADQTTEKMQVTGSKDNQLFYDYLAYLAKQRPVAESLNKGIAAATDNNAKKGIQQKLEQLNVQVRAHQEELVKQNPKTLTAALVRANIA
ncbi:MAG: DUF4369 domain-containing protein, partial [Bacteroidota bacterium]